MARQTISLFMWGYQPHFRHHVEYVTREALKQLGISVDATVLLVGARRPGHKNRNAVCVEPEDGQWPLSLFDGLLESIETIVLEHPLQKIFYSDRESTEDKPEVIRRDSVSLAVRRALKPFEAQNDVQFFIGESWPVDDFYVVPIIQVPTSLFKKFPPLKERPPKNEFSWSGHSSVIHATLSTVLKEATAALQGPDPGRSLHDNTRRADEIVRRAAESFMRTPGFATTTQYTSGDLFFRLNLISSSLYEGARGIGRLLLTNPSNPNIEHLLRFRTPVRIHDTRWTRKVLELAGPHGALIADSEFVYGLGRLSPSYSLDDQSIFAVDFMDHYNWELRNV